MQPPSQYLQCFCDHFWTCTAWQKIAFHVCSQLRVEVRCPEFLLKFSYCEQKCFLVGGDGEHSLKSNVPYFSYFCSFFWWFHCLKWPLSIVLKGCTVFLSTGRLWSALWRKICVLDKLPLAMSHSAIGCEINVYKSAIGYIHK